MFDNGRREITWNGGVEYYVTELSCYLHSYLQKVDKAESVDCMYFPGVTDNLACGRWQLQPL